MLPFPPFSVRLGLVCGQIFTYTAAGQVSIGNKEADLLSQIFIGSSKHLSESYLHDVEDTRVFREAAVRVEQRNRLFDRVEGEPRGGLAGSLES